MEGFVKMSRRITEMFEKDAAGSHLYARLLREAAIKDRVVLAAGGPVGLKKGQLVFGIHQWVDKTGLTEKVIRSRMKVLEEVGEVVKQSRSKYSIVSITSLIDGQAQVKQDGKSEGATQDHSKNNEHRDKEDGSSTDLVATAPKKVVQELDWSPLNLTPEHLEAVKAIRKKHGSKGKVSQRVIDTLSQEFAKARAGGFSDEQIISEWDMRGWLGFKAEWLFKDRQQGAGPRPSRYEQQMAAQAAMNARFLGIPQPDQHHQGGFTYEHQ